MHIRVALVAMAAVTLAAMGQAGAQSPFPPVNQQASPFPPVNQQASPFPPVNQQASPFPPAGATQVSPFPSGGMAQPQKPPCYDEFAPLREEMDKRLEPTRAALGRLQAAKDEDKRAIAIEICKLSTRFSESENKMVQFVEKHGSRCQIPPQVLEGMKKSQAMTADIKTKTCRAMAAPAGPARPAAPTLSDALTMPAPSASNTRTGRGTLDSLSGNPLAR